MKQLKEIKDKEKIKTFNSLYRFCREEVTAMKNSLEYDGKIDNEYLLNKILGLTPEDWNKINRRSRKGNFFISETPKIKKERKKWEKKYGC